MNEIGLRWPKVIEKPLLDGGVGNVVAKNGRRRWRGLGSEEEDDDAKVESICRKVCVHCNALS